MNEMKFTDGIRAKAKALNLKVAFPDAEDIRVLMAARYLIDEKIAQPVLVGNENNIKKIAESNNVKIVDIEIINPAKADVKKENQKVYHLKKQILWLRLHFILQVCF